LGLELGCGPQLQDRGTDQELITRLQASRAMDLNTVDESSVPRVEILHVRLLALEQETYMLP
jgi:hypothetical protein